VNLPPSLDELNDYGKYAVLTEMHTVASQIATWIRGHDQSPLVERVELGVDLIEAELTEMRDRCQNRPFVRPDSDHVVRLIVRCAELYLDRGTWFDLCHADLRLREKHSEYSRADIQGVFHETELTHLYPIESPIIELTFTRYDMMKFFQDQEDQILTGSSMYELDPTSSYKVVENRPTPSQAEMMNQAEFPDGEFDTMLMGDEEYLEKREEFIWVIYRNFRCPASIFCVIYFLIVTALSINEVVHANRRYPVPETLFTGYALGMLVVELASCRICLIACWRPKSTIPFIYPGLEYAMIQFLAAIIGPVIIAISIPADKARCGMLMVGLTVHHIGSLLASALCAPCFFRTHARVERQFRWIRIEFFRSCWWFVVRVVFFILMTPGVYGVQMMIIYRLRNKTSVAKEAEQPALLETA